MQPLHDPACQHLIIRLLLGRTASSFEQAAFPVEDRPFLLQPAVRSIIRRHQADRFAVRRVTKQDIAHILGKRIFKKVDFMTRNLPIGGADPILIRQGKPQAFLQQHLRGTDVQFLQRMAQAGTACRDCPPPPPFIERGAVNLPFFNRDAHRNMSRVNYLLNSGNRGRFAVQTDFRHGDFPVHQNICLHCFHHFLISNLLLLFYQIAGT